MTILALWFWIFLNTIGFWCDAYLNNHGKEKLGGQSLKRDIVSFLVKLVLAFLIILFILYKGDTRQVTEREAFGAFLIFGAVAWILEVIYNLIRKKVKWNHVGTTSVTDKPFHRFKHPFLVQSVAKMILLATGLMLYLL